MAKNKNIYKLGLPITIIVAFLLIFHLVLPRLRNLSFEIFLQILFVTWSIFLISSATSYLTAAWRYAKDADIIYNFRLLLIIIIFFFFGFSLVFLWDIETGLVCKWGGILLVPITIPLVIIFSFLLSTIYFSIQKANKKRARFIFIPISVAVVSGIIIYVLFVPPRSDFRPRIVYNVNIESDGEDITLYLPFLTYKDEPVKEILNTFEGEGFFDLVNTRYGKMLNVYIPRLPYNKSSNIKYINIRGDKELEYTGIKSAVNRTAISDFRINPRLEDDEEKIIYNTYSSDIVTAQKLSTAIYADFKGQFLDIKISCDMTAPFKETRDILFWPFHGGGPVLLADSIAYDICPGELSAKEMYRYNILSKDKEKEGKLHQWHKESSKEGRITKCGWHFVPMIETKSRKE